MTLRQPRARRRSREPISRTGERSGGEIPACQRRHSSREGHHAGARPRNIALTEQFHVLEFDDRNENPTADAYLFNAAGLAVAGRTTERPHISQQLHSLIDDTRKCSPRPIVAAVKGVFTS